MRFAKRNDSKLDTPSSNTRRSKSFELHIQVKGNGNFHSEDDFLSAITCTLQVMWYFLAVVPKPNSAHRSGCPVSISLEVLGDRWSLLIVRDLMVRGYHTFKEFQQAGEGIATNILADRLKKLQRAGIVSTEPEESDRRKINYRLTEKGIDLAPVMLELLIWGARHQETGAPCAVIEAMVRNRKEVLAETRRRWRDRDPNPILPRFDGAA